jgi:tRNA(Ile)-lysidine synthase
MALLLLTQAWVKEQHGKIIALTVDHGLRPEAEAEAKQVSAWCKKLGIEHHILRAQDSGFRIQKRIQEAARDARYSLLTGWCKKHGVGHLLTAHHQGDQAETFFFRLARGSGIDGLACMSSVSNLDGIRLIRPLLNIPKAELIALLKAEGQPWIEDPSNQNPRYTRVRIRSAIAASANADDIIRRAADLAQRFGRIRAIMEKELSRRLPEVVVFSAEGGLIDLAAFKQLPEVYALKMLSLLAQKLGSSAYPPRSEKLERLYGDIMHGRIRKQRSFAGLLFIAAKSGLHIRHEPKRLEKSAPRPMFKRHT